MTRPQAGHTGGKNNEEISFRGENISTILHCPAHCLRIVLRDKNGPGCFVKLSHFGKTYRIRNQKDSYREPKTPSPDHIFKNVADL